MFDTPFVLLDTEYTAWEGSRESAWSGSGEYREMIQIGAIIVDENLRERSPFMCYVRPVKNPILSDFIIELTGISQEMVDVRGISLDQALKVLSVAVQGLPIYCYGRDGQFLRENCALLGIHFPFEPERFIDIRPYLKAPLAVEHIDITQYSSGELVQAFGLEGGRAHDALNDVQNLLKIIQVLRSRGRL